MFYRLKMARTHQCIIPHHRIFSAIDLDLTCVRFQRALSTPCQTREEDQKRIRRYVEARPNVSSTHKHNYIHQNKSPQARVSTLRGFWRERPLAVKHINMRTDSVLCHRLKIWRSRAIEFVTEKNRIELRNQADVLFKKAE